MRLPALFPVALVVTLLAACSGPAPRPVTSTGTISQAPLAVSEQGNEVALYALGLIDTGYRFGGKDFGRRGDVIAVGFESAGERRRYRPQWPHH